MKEETQKANNADQSVKKSIQFKPLSEGLGFHPFSDGMPYTPVGHGQKPQASRVSSSLSNLQSGLPNYSGNQTTHGQNRAPHSGSGATSAGAPFFNNPARPSPLHASKSFPTRPSFHSISQAAPHSTPQAAPQTGPRASAETATSVGAQTYYGATPQATTFSGAVAAGASTFAQPANTKPSRISVPVVQQPAVAPTSVQSQPAPVGVIYVFQRLIAYCLDLGINLFLAVTGFCAILIIYQIKLDLISNPTGLMLILLFSIVFHWTLMTAQEVVFGTTIGKKLFRLKLVGSELRIVMRSLLFIPSLLLGGLGLLPAIFGSKHRGLHDSISGITPVNTANQNW